MHMFQQNHQPSGQWQNKSYLFSMTIILHNIVLFSNNCRYVQPCVTYKLFPLHEKTNNYYTYYNCTRNKVDGHLNKNKTSKLSSQQKELIPISDYIFAMQVKVKSHSSYKKNNSQITDVWICMCVCWWGEGTHTTTNVISFIIITILRNKHYIKYYRWCRAREVCVGI